MLTTLSDERAGHRSLCGRRYGNARGTYVHSSQPERFSGVGIVSAAALTELLRLHACACEPVPRRLIADARDTQIVHQLVRVDSGASRSPTSSPIALEDEATPAPASWQARSRTSERARRRSTPRARY